MEIRTLPRDYFKMKRSLPTWPPVGMKMGSVITHLHTNTPQLAAVGMVAKPT
jgi:hypothetical protein